MKIANYNIQQKSTSQLEKRKEVSEKLEAWGIRKTALKEEPSFILDINSVKKTHEYAAKKTCLKSVDNEENLNDQDTDIKLKLIESFIYMTTGRRVRLKSPKLKLDKSKDSLKDANKDDSAVIDAQVRDGWGLVYEYHEVSYKNERLHFHSAGSVQTTDGRIISFDLDFTLSRAFYEEKNINLRFGDAARVDPLIIALKGGAVEFSKEKYEFDLDGDGDKEKISLASGNSGFLALDKNNNGIIDDGSELFGPETGNGFKELAAYDLDNNCWIDEADEIFGKLSILTLSENNEKTLFKLGDAGVGAIYLSGISTLFELKDGLDAYGEMKSSSVFLREDGTAGTIHHVDLNV